MRVGFIVVLFLVLLSLSFAAGPEPIIEVPELGLGFLALVALLSVLIISFSSMLAKSFQSPELMAWSKTQLTQLIASVILVVIIWSAVFGTNTMVSAIFLQSGEESLVELGETSLDPLLEYMETLYSKTADAYLSVGILQGTSYYTVVAPAWWVYFSQGNSPYYGVSILLGPLSVAASNLTTQILTLKLIQVFLVYLDKVGAGFLLPIALAFRILPFTRNMGNTLIALSLGALFVLPLSLMVVGEFYTVASTSLDAGFQYDNGPQGDVLGTSFKVEDMGPSSNIMDVSKRILKGVCKNSVLRTFTELGELIWGLVYGLIMMATCGPPPTYPACFAEKFIYFIMELWPKIMFFAELAFAGIIVPPMAADLISDSADAGFSDIPYVLLPAVMEVTGFSILSFFIIVFITFGGVRAISAALGGDYVLYGLSRFV